MGSTAADANEIDANEIAVNAIETNATETNAVGASAVGASARDTLSGRDSTHVVDLRTAIDACRAAATSMTPPEYDRLIDELASKLPDDEHTHQTFRVCADALRHMTINEHLDEEVQDLQWQLNSVYQVLEALGAAASLPCGLATPATSMPWPGLPWPAGELGHEFERVLNGLGRFVHGVRQEHDEARRVQTMLLPRHEELVLEAAHLAAFYRPAHGCGGDFWTVERLPDQRLLVVVGDVTGHGSAAAIVTGVARAACDALLAREGDVTCAGLLQALNQIMYRIVGGEVHMTAVASLIDPIRGEMSTCNAGHPLPYLLSRGQDSGNLKQIITSGTPLGASEESRYETVYTPIASGDLVLWYSDGITECCDAEGIEFGERALRKLLRASTTRSATQLRDEIIAEVSQFCAESVLGDDVTVVAGVMMPMRYL